MMEAWATFLGRTMNKGWWKHVQPVLDSLDKNGDKELSWKELHEAFKEHGLGSIKEAIEHLSTSDKGDDSDSESDSDDE